MGRIIRKLSKINTDYLLIGLIIIIGIIWVITPIVFAQTNSTIVPTNSTIVPTDGTITRDELVELKEQEDTARDDMDDKEIELTDQRKLIREQEDEIESLRVELKKVETGADWDSLKIKMDLEDGLQEAKDLLQEYRNDLTDILRERSDLVKLIKSLNFDIDHSTIYSPQNLSHLVKKIGVSLSKSCEIMLKNNFTTNCPTYKQLVQLDSSDTGISGKFTTDEDGFFHRGDEPVLNSYKYYWNDEQIRIFVDPPSGMAERIKMIYIQPNFNTYTIAGDMTIQDEFEVFIANRTESLNNQTRIVEWENRTQTLSFGTVIYHDRYIDKCKNATINANDWRFLIGDTIHLMRNNCDRDFTAFEEREVILPEYSEIDVTTSPNWIFLQAQKFIEESCIFKYKQC